MRLDEIPNEYRLATRHNPNHFMANSFEIVQSGGRLIVVGRVKRRVKKGFRVVGVLKRR